MINPTLVVEVLSDGTEEYDRGEKLAGDKTVPSLREVLLVSHRERRLDLWRRDDAGWAHVAGRGGEVLELVSVGRSLNVDALYARTPSIR